MALSPLSAPALEPLSLNEAKAHLRVDTGDEDTLIDSLITTARLQLEAALNAAFITQQWQWTFDCWPMSTIIELPLRPLQTIDAVRVVDGDGTPTLIDPVTYAVDAAADIPRIASRSGYWPTPGARLNGIEIDFTAGFGAAPTDVPEDIRHAILLLIAHWFEHREPPGATTATTSGPVAIPDAVSVLLKRFRVARL